MVKLVLALVKCLVIEECQFSDTLVFENIFCVHILCTFFIMKNGSVIRTVYKCSNLTEDLMHM